MNNPGSTLKHTAQAAQGSNCQHEMLSFLICGERAVKILQHQPPEIDKSGFSRSKQQRTSLHMRRRRRFCSASASRYDYNLVVERPCLRYHRICAEFACVA